MLRRLLLILSLVFLFGLGQQGAAVHAISHFADERGESQQDKKAPHLSFCDKCMVYASLGNAVGSHHQVFAVSASHPAPFIESGIRRCSELTLHYAARAPPRLA